MIKRCVHIFPRFEDGGILKDVRKKYDNLYGLIEPHITIVFPFESNLKDDEILLDLRKHLKTIKPFRLVVSGIEAVESHGFYLFSNVKEGSEVIKELHYSVHKGLLKAYQSPWTKDGSYKPHITIGRFFAKDEMHRAFNEFKDVEFNLETMVDRVYVEIIGENDESIIESEIIFGSE